MASEPEQSTRNPSTEQARDAEPEWRAELRRAKEEAEHELCRIHREAAETARRLGHGL